MFETKPKRFTVDDLLARVYEVAGKLVSQTYADSNQTFLVFVLEVVAYLILDLSVYFQPQILQLWDSTQVAQLVNFCSIINPTTYINTAIIHTISQILTMSVISLGIMFLLLIVLQIWERKVVSMICVQLLRLLKLCTVPLGQLLLFNFSCGDVCRDSNSVIKPFSVIAFVAMVLMVTLYQRFYFLPLKKNNLYFRLGSDLQTYQYLMTIIKLIIFSTGSLQYTYIFFFAVGHLGVLFRKLGCVNGHTRHLQTLLSYMNVLTCVVILLNWAFRNGDIIFFVWILSTLSLLIATIIRFAFNISSNLNNFSECRNASPDLFLEFMEKVGSMGTDTDKIHLLTGFIAVHSRACQDPHCYLRENRPQIQKQLSSNSTTDRKESAQTLQKVVEQFINNYLLRKSQDNQIYAIAYYVRLYEFNRYEALRRLDRTITSLDYQFARAYVFKLLDSDQINEDYQVTEENFFETKQVFYKQLKSVNTVLTKFVTELKYKEARLSIVEDYGYQSCVQIEELRRLFQKITRNNRLDFKIIQLYLEFVTNFLKDKTYSEQVVAKLKKKSKNLFDDYVIEESSQPTVEISRKDEARIVNINAQAIKYFGCHRIEMMEKNLFNFLIPEVPATKCEEIFNTLANQSVVCLARTRRNTIFPVRVRTRVKDLSNRKQYFVEFMVLRKLSNQTFLMLDDQFNATFCSDKQIILKGSAYDVSSLFQLNIKSLKDDLLTNKIIETEYPPNFTLTARLENSLLPNSYFLYLEFEHKLNEKKMTFQSKDAMKFNFWVQRSGKAVFEGCPIERDWTYIPEEEVQADLAEDVASSRVRVNYSKGIKSYRLDDDIIYNIQLEESNSRQEDFVEEKEKTEIEAQKRRRKSMLNALYLAAIGICCIFFAAIIFKILYEVSTTSALRSQYAKFVDIEVYQLKFFRMAGVLRDGLEGVAYKNNVQWGDQLLLTFNQIQASQKSQLFSNKQVTIMINGTAYSSYLDQICNIILSRMYNLAMFRTTAGAEELLKVISQVIVPAVKAEKALTSDSMGNSLTSLVTYEVVVFGVHMLLCVLMFIVVVIISLNQTETKKGMLLCYGMMPDTQIQSYLQRLQRFEYLIIMTEKNEDVEIYSVLEDKTQYGKREAPKKYLSKLSEHTRLMVLQAAIIFLNVLIFYFIITASQGVVNMLQQVLRSNKQLSNIYGGFLQVAAEKISGLSYSSHLDEIKQSLVDFQKGKSNLPYSQPFTSYLDQVLFGNSCTIVQGWLMGLPCFGFAEGFSLANPFNEGLTYYLQSMYLFLQDKLQQVYPCTGMLSLPFYKVFEQINFKTQVQWDASITVAIQQAYANTIFHMIEFIALCLIIVITYNNNDTVKQKISKVCALIKSEQSSSNVSKVGIKAIKETQVTEATQI